MLRSRPCLIRATSISARARNFKPIGWGQQSASSLPDYPRPPPSARVRATEDLVNKGAELVRTQGADAIAEFHKPGSEWFDGETYLFAYDFDNNVLFNSASPEKKGLCTLGHPDANGKLFHDELVRVAQADGSGWVGYAWPKPGQEEASQKWTFSKAVSIDGKPAALMSGFYLS
jgi:cytochrome c